MGTLYSFSTIKTFIDRTERLKVVTISRSNKHRIGGEAPNAAEISTAFFRKITYF